MAEQIELKVDKLETYQADRVRINIEGNIDVYVIKTDEGYVIDTYVHAEDESGDFLNTMTVWEDEYQEDTEEDEEDE